MSKTTATKYGVADGDRIIGDLFDNVDTARRHEAWVQDTSAQLGVESGARLVTVDVTTTYDRPHVYREPEAVVEEAAPESKPARAPKAPKQPDTPETTE